MFGWVLLLTTQENTLEPPKKEDPLIQSMEWWSAKKYTNLRVDVRYKSF